MARLHLGGRDTARVHMYGTMNMDTVNFIQNRIDNITNLYGEGAAWFQDKLQQRFNDSAIRSINIAQNNMRYSGGVFDDGIRQMFSIDDFRVASRNNQRYILSNPYFQKEYSSGRIGDLKKTDSLNSQVKTIHIINKWWMVWFSTLMRITMVKNTMRNLSFIPMTH